ncbi:hypothetical protein SCLCIDRAFT_126574 [Scleroderma citrinum Foug A]|uniref:Cytochrome P450 n=1 Tax=Scleroderma citrinum Foug A TaxID=1036808 RepID=A0A0C3DT88_9AGAM|nr:hypothetical protein SCLCIDRAFT_126574 [Scleroderma citrinum Foug A]
MFPLHDDVAKIATFSALTISFAFVALRAWRNRKITHGSRSLPGPQGLPFIGSVLSINIGEPWLTYTEWSKCYGGIFYTTSLGRNMVIINDEKIAYELLERRSTIYSSRPYSTTNELSGTGCIMPFLPYGSTWKLHRKMYHTAFNRQVTMEYRPMQTEKAYQLLGSLITTPHEYAKHLETFAGSVILEITYGYYANGQDDTFISQVKRVRDLGDRLMAPKRAALLNTFPILAYLPLWLLGRQYEQRVGEIRSSVQQAVDDPFEYVRDEMANGSARKSLVHDLLLEQVGKAHNHEYDETVKAVAASAFFAGVDTTLSALLVFMLAMTLYPEVQVRAQEEIDRVVGRDHLPDFGDRDNLPYVEAILMETLRWHPIAPLGLPHTTTKDDVFDGMYIPRGVLYILLLKPHRGMSRDETKFPDPTRFNPERHLTADGLVESASSPVFGLGRRICPGRYVAAQSMWAAIACILATLRIANAKDEHGNPIAVVPEFTTGLVIHPESFPCSIEARTSSAEQLIQSRVCK